MIKKLAIFALVTPVALMQAMDRVTAGAEDSTALSKKLLDDAGSCKGLTGGTFSEQESSVVKARRLVTLVNHYILHGGNLKDIQNCLSSGAEADLELPGICKNPACVNCDQGMTCIKMLQGMEVQLGAVQNMKTLMSKAGQEVLPTIKSSGKVPTMAQQVGLYEEVFLSEFEGMLTAIENGAIDRIQELKLLLNSSNEDLDSSDGDDDVLDRALDEMDREERVKNDELAQGGAGNKAGDNNTDQSKPAPRKKKPAPQKESSWSSWFNYKTVGLAAVGIVTLVVGKKYFYDKDKSNKRIV